jgi:hypothetical protein
MAARLAGRSTEVALRKMRQIAAISLLLSPRERSMEPTDIVYLDDWSKYSIPP